MCYPIDESLPKDEVEHIHKLLLDDISTILTGGSVEEVVESYNLAFNKLTVLSRHRLSILNRRYIVK